MKKTLLICLMLVASVTLTQAQVVYVDADRPDDNGDGTSWATARKLLRLVLYNATSGQQIWVRAGRYTPSPNSRDSFVLKNGVEVYGGFDGTETLLSQRNEIHNLTILSGDIGNNDNGDLNNMADNSLSVVRNENLNSTAILDGFTITGGIGLGVDGGGGIQNFNSSPTIRNTIFAGNMSYGQKGGAVYNTEGSPTFINCVFYKNSAVAGSAMHNVNASPTISNCIFTENSCDYDGVILTSGQFGSKPMMIINSTIVSNHRTSGLAGIVVSKTDVIIQNCIFDNNDVNSGSHSSDLSSEWSSVSVAYSIFSNGHPGKGIIKGSDQSPAFVDISNPAGPDGLWRTADDGLRLQCGSSAINTGRNDYCDVTISTRDILGVPRTATFDMGAYEGGFADQQAGSIAAANTTILFDQSADGTTSYATCDELVASLSSADAYTVAGSVVAKVWLETTQPTNYVKRHYEIAPAINATTATGKVTLYFTQQEFDDFNAVSSTKLPINAADIAGYKDNLRIEKRSGISSDGTGLPGTYDAASFVTLKPSNANGDVVWNGTDSRWEVSFEVTGFSGFFVKTAEGALPLRLMGFSGVQEETTNKLQWHTADEVNTDRFELESSKDGRHFQKVATIAAVSTGGNSYDYTDATVYKGILYYRLKMIDTDGSFAYSRMVSLSRDGNSTIQLYPNPVTSQLTISLDKRLINSEAVLFSIAGKRLQTIKIASVETKINIESLAAGAYVIKFKDGTAETFIKE